MEKEKVNPREELLAYKYDFHLMQKLPCSKEENKAYTKLLKDGKPLPEGVLKYDYSYNEGTEDFYTIYTPDLTDEEIAEYLTYKKLALLRTIKNCVVFFTVLTVIGLVSALLITLSAL